jgi:hypothetical protein
MHFGQVLPQSTSVSVPLLTKSEQVGVWHLPPVQTLLLQSEVPLQPSPVPHAGQPPPPQSTPDSVPFCTVSEQVGAWHLLPVHRPLAQSELAPQDASDGHFGHAAPPQSLSDSVPFLTPSLHSGEEQTLLLALALQ